MKVVRHEAVPLPPPPPPPPPTYDIVGLTYDELLVIRCALMHAYDRQRPSDGPYKPDEAKRLFHYIAEGL